MNFLCFSGMMLLLGRVFVGKNGMDKNGALFGVELDHSFNQGCFTV